jgi:hypothetical protein
MEECKVAFTGQKVKGSRVLTPETVENRGKFYKLMNEIKENDEVQYDTTVKQMFYSMFEHLSHSAQTEFVEWADRVEWNTLKSL